MESGIQSGKKPYAVVFSLDSMNGLQICRTLARQGIPVIGIAGDPKHPACWTRVCEKVTVATSRGDRAIRTLEALGTTLGSKAVLFVCNGLTSKEELPS